MAKNTQAPTLPSTMPTVYALPPKLPADPGYMGSYSQQAFQMAGPRVGFVQPPVSAGYQSSLPYTPPAPGAFQAPQPQMPASMINPFLGRAPLAGFSGGGTIRDLMLHSMRAF